MRLRRLLLVGACVLLSVERVAQASCGVEPGGGDQYAWFGRDWVVTYDGDIDGSIPIRMTLVFEDGKLQGQYFYTQHLTNIDVRGVVRRDRSLELVELNGDGTTRATFSGTFLESDVRGNYGPATKLVCEVLSGLWIDKASGRTRPFYLSLQFASVGALGDKYRMLDWKRRDEASIEGVARRFVSAFLANDKKTVAALLHYPMHVVVSSDEVRLVSNAAQLLSVYDSAFPPVIRDSINNAVPMHMSKSSNLVRIGKVIGPWIGPDMKVWVNGAEP
jgi:hypothetical protein